MIFQVGYTTRKLDREIEYAQKEEEEMIQKKMIEQADGDEKMLDELKAARDADKCPITGKYTIECRQERLVKILERTK